MAIVSLVGPTLTNAFSVDRKENWFEHCRLECRPLYYGRHVDDIFVLFSLPERLKRVHSYKKFLPTQHIFYSRE